MGDFAELSVWREPATARALSWYLDVAENRKPAKCRIAATIPVKYRPQYAEIARRPEGTEIRDAYPYAERLGLNYEPVTFDRHAPERFALIPGI